MSNPSVSMRKLPIKGIFLIILKGNDFKWWGQNTDRKNYVGFTYNIPIIIYSVGGFMYIYGVPFHAAIAFCFDMKLSFHSIFDLM